MTKAEELWRSGNESKTIDHFRRALKIICEMSHKLLKVRYCFEVSSHAKFVLLEV